MSVYKGIKHIIHPAPLIDPTWNYIVLACAALFEGTSFIIAIRKFIQRQGKKNFWSDLSDSKDPAPGSVP
jgi:hypothetical protein